MYLVSLFMLALQSAAGYCLCTRRYFYEMEARYYPEHILLSVTSRQVHVTDCWRACILDPRCFAYQMRWTDADTQTGYCQTVSFDAEGYNGSENNSTYTLYALCPWSMHFYETTSKCYLFVGGRQYSWQGGWNYCKSLHPRAHLMDIQSADEQQIAHHLAVMSSGTWIGGRRYTTGVHDFVWAYTNTSVQDSGFEHWKSGEPTDPRNPTDPADCMRMKNGNLWVDSRCNRYFDILCEI